MKAVDSGHSVFVTDNGDGELSYIRIDTCEGSFLRHFCSWTIGRTLIGGIEDVFVMEAGAVVVLEVVPSRASKRTADLWLTEFLKRLWALPDSARNEIRARSAVLAEETVHGALAVSSVTATAGGRERD